MGCTSQPPPSLPSLADSPWSGLFSALQLCCDPPHCCLSTFVPLLPMSISSPVYYLPPYLFTPNLLPALFLLFFVLPPPLFVEFLIWIPFPKAKGLITECEFDDSCRLTWIGTFEELKREIVGLRRWEFDWPLLSEFKIVGRDRIRWLIGNNQLGIERIEDEVWEVVGQKWLSSCRSTPTAFSTMTSTFFYPLPSYNSPSTSNSTSTSTLILPSISVGSVPQLATDLLIHHKPLALRKVARLDSNLCWGFFGAEERDGEEDQEGCTALEGE